MNYVYLRFPGGKPKAFTISYDDGYIYDLRLADMIEAHGMKCTFNIISESVTKNWGSEYLTLDQMKSLITRGYEIAVHGVTHTANGLQKVTLGLSEAYESRKVIENKLGIISRGFAYPCSGINDFTVGTDYEHIKGYLRDLGYSYARSDEKNFDYFLIPNDWYDWQPTVHHDSRHVNEYADMFLDIKPDGHDGKGGLPRLFHIYGHSAEFERKNNWEHLEALCEKLGGKDDIWYATNLEICDYVEDYKRLKFNLDHTRVYNPSARTIWFYADEKTYAVAPGETVNLI